MGRLCRWHQRELPELAEWKKQRQPPSVTGSFLHPTINADTFSAALVPEGDALAVGARMLLAQLQVHRVDVRVQVAHLPEGYAIAVGARVRPHLLVDGLAVPHAARRAEAAAAVWALVVAPPLVHRPTVPHHVALLPE